MYLTSIQVHYSCPARPCGSAGLFFAEHECLFCYWQQIIFRYFDSWVELVSRLEQLVFMSFYKFEALLVRGAKPCHDNQIGFHHLMQRIAEPDVIHVEPLGCFLIRKAIECAERIAIGSERAGKCFAW